MWTFLSIITMKTSYLILLLGLLSAFSVASAQPVWQRVGNCTFRGIQKLPSGHVVMVTDGGGFYSSSDDGASWAFDTIDPSMVLTSVSFFDNLNGIAGAGATGKAAIEVTHDGGKTWSAKTSSLIRGIFSVSASSRDTFYATSYASPGGLLRSTDAGETWNKIIVPDTAKLTITKFISSQEGYVAGESGFVAMTTDAGNSWSQLLTGITSPILSLDIHGTRLAIGSQDPVNGEGLIGLSSDAGQHWAYSSFGDSLFGSVSIVRFVSVDTLVGFVSNNYFHFTTTDFGTSWIHARVSPDYQHEKYQAVNLSDAYVDANGNGLVCGYSGTIYRITDHGLDGHLQSHCTVPDNVAYLEPVRGNLNWIHGVGLNGTFINSSNQGLTWYAHTDPSYDKAGYVGLHFSSVSTGVLFTWMGLQANYFDFQRTTDTGRDWIPLNTPRTSTLYGSANGFDGYQYVMGDSLVIRSTDDGSSWQTYTRFWTTSPPVAGRVIQHVIFSDGAFFGNGRACLLVLEIDSFLDAQNLKELAYPAYCAVMTTDDGQNWSKPFYFADGRYMTNLAFINSNLGYAIGDNSLLYRTTDGGLNWSYVPGLDSVHMYLRFNPSGTIGIASGDYGRLFETFDSGYTWRRVDPRYPSGNQNVNFAAAYFDGDSVAILNSNQGFWRKTFSLPASQEEVSPLVPANAESLTVYPNPASGLLHIESTSNEIVIMDLLGRTWLHSKDGARDLNVSGLPHRLLP